MRLLRERPARPLDADTVDDFAEKFETRYARIRDRRNARGGFGEEEIRALCRIKNLNVTDEMIASCRQQIAEQALAGLEVALFERVFASQGWSDAEAEAMLPRLVIIHDRLTVYKAARAFKHRLSVRDKTVQEVLAEIEGATPRQAFAALNNSLGNEGLELLGSVAEPIEADVYLAPS
jgi:hypothetical protein